MRVSPSLLLALAATAATIAPPARADEAALAVRVEKMQAELDSLKAELLKLKAQSTPPAAAATTPAVATPNAQVGAAAINDSGAKTPLPYAMAPGSPFATTSPVAPAATVFGYGAITYANYPTEKSQTQADMARAVIGIGHRFDERTRFVGEFEWERAVTSADDQGEAEFYVERSFAPQLAGRTGLFLIPSGMLNIAHEPTQYFGVTRDFVNPSIIATTWREGGVALTGVIPYDLTWNVGITTGFNLANWDRTSDDGKFSPLVQCSTLCGT